MNEKKLYLQKKQAQLNEWRAEVDKLKAQASGTSADMRMKLNMQIVALEAKIEQGKAKLAEIVDSSEGAWESIKEGFESAWDSMKSAYSDATAKFKN